MMSLALLAGLIIPLDEAAGRATVKVDAKAITPA
jgi:hypothetical protein